MSASGVGKPKFLEQLQELFQEDVITRLTEPFELEDEEGKEYQMEFEVDSLDVS